MAKISTYATTAPDLGDMLIGTDVNDMNSTKNFTIGSLLSLPGSTAYVPYTGALYNVDLGANDITANSIIKAGGTSSQFLKADGSIDSNTYALASSLASYVPYVGATNNLDLGGNDLIATTIIKSGGLATEFLKADGSVDNNTYLTTAIISGLVPYTGATGNVDLGSNRLTATSLRITTDDAEMVGISCFPGAQDYFSIGNNGWTASGFLVDFVNNRYFLGDWGSAVNGTYIKIDDANSRVEISKALYTNASTGTSGQILTSQGAGLPATWSTASYLVPKYGSFYDTTTQTTAGNENLPMKLNTTDVAATSGFSIANDALGRPTRITTTETGIFNVQFSAQLHKTSGGGATQIYIWFAVNGVDLADSATTLTLANNGDLLVAAWNYFVPLTTGQYVEIKWRASAANIEIQRNTTLPSVPGIPSVIATIHRVS
jgi:hypothetical protein